jgi:hypothetical protein
MKPCHTRKKVETRTMLRFGLGVALALTILPGTASVAQTAKPADKAQPGKAHADKAQPGVVPPLPERRTDKAAAATPPPPDVWSPAEIEAAKVRCTAALKGLNAIVTYETPIKEGDCGNPAPIRLAKLDNVIFSPGALINCGMLAPLHTWITKDLQPLARRQLGSRITSIQVMSDYSCRTAFGRVGKKLSEHAYVDALDIRGFVTDKGQAVSVLEGWGVTNRDIAAAEAAAKARDAKLADATAATAKSAPLNGNAPTGKQAKTGASLLKPTRVDDMVTAILPGGSKGQQMAARLGGPPDKAGLAKRSDGKAGKPGEKTAALNPSALNPATRIPAALATPPDGPRARFLHEAHAAACRIFGTTLGPEANEAHRNHFHVDMAERKIKKICD